MNTYIVTDYDSSESLQQLTIENGGLVQLIDSAGNLTTSISHYYDRFHNAIRTRCSENEWGIGGYTKNRSSNHYRMKCYKLYDTERLSYWLVKDKKDHPKTASLVLYYRSGTPTLLVEDIGRVLNRPLYLHPIPDNTKYGLDLSVRCVRSLLDYPEEIRKQLYNILRILAYIEDVCVSECDLYRFNKFSRIEEGTPSNSTYLRMVPCGTGYDVPYRSSYVWVEGNNVISHEGAHYLAEMTYELWLPGNRVITHPRRDTIHYSNHTYAVRYCKDTISLTSPNRETITRYNHPEDAIIAIAINIVTAVLSEEHRKLFDKCCVPVPRYNKTLIDALQSPTDEPFRLLKERYDQLIEQKNYLMDQFELLTTSNAKYILEGESEINIKL